MWMRIRASLAAMFIVLFLVGCGQKGPLYFPDEQDQEEEEQSSNAAPPRYA